MIKQISMAALLLATMLGVSCSKDETCARCELIETCATCNGGSMDGQQHCGTGSDAEAFEGDCELNGGTITVDSTTVDDTHDYCDEEPQLVDIFMNDKRNQGFTCGYVD